MHHEDVIISYTGVKSSQYEKMYRDNTINTKCINSDNSVVKKYAIGFYHKNDTNMNYYSRFGLIIVQYLLCQTLCESDNSQYRINNGGFLFSISKALVSVERKTVFHGYEFGNRKHCFEVIVPRLEIKDPIYVNLRVQVHSNGAIQSAHNQDPILIFPTRVVRTFIDTDRGIYKPGEKIKFRILVLDQKLLPINTKIQKIRIINPADISVAIWEDVVLENGLVSLEYEMVQEAMIGKWKIETSGKKKSFEVSKYTLPRFRINLLHPKLIYRKTESFRVSVCAEYSYGRYVEGLAFVKIFDSFGNMRPIHQLKEMKGGCGYFLFTSEELMLRMNEKHSHYDQKMYIHITATVSERGTNRIELANARSLVQLQAYSMKFINDPSSNQDSHFMEH
ncbi:hypothetical protein JTB14_022628 [Gonioctena quinquepunctata]|nr:hypothetical protein JTB14_022628 [Gonioctena quinquepunctata]